MATNTAMTAGPLSEIRQLVESAGFLPMSNKAERLFDAAAKVPGVREEVQALREAYQSVGYLSRTKAQRLIELASRASG